MVGVAQLVELRLVMPAVVGSSPIVHPIQLADLIDIFVARSVAWTFRGHFYLTVAQMAACSASASASINRVVVVESAIKCFEIFSLLPMLRTCCGDPAGVTNENFTRRNKLK